MRNATMMLLLIDGALKVGELVGKERLGAEIEGGLRVSDVDWKQAAVQIRSVGKPERTVGLSLATMQYVRAWVEQRPHSELDLLFVTRRGTKVQNRYVRRMLQEYAVAAGIGEWVRPSTLRKTGAARLLRETGDLREVQQRLGLQHFASSLRYAPLREGFMENGESSP